MKSRTSLIISLIKRGYDPAQIVVMLAIRRSLARCEHVLDVGCGKAPTMKLLGVPHSTGIEGYRPDFEEAQRRKVHEQMVFGDIKNLSQYFAPNQFDACVALDVIEHFTKDDGLKLMKDMERIAKKRVIFFTPSGFLPQRHATDGDLQVHLSGWEAREMEQYGYNVIGLLGPKSLRGEGHGLKRRPVIFWAVVSILGQIFWTRYHPEKAAAIFCVRTVPMRKDSVE
ncbi:MAG: methyltransferase domain-containing protein [Verrucomicrobiota bacterium]|jgi:SAM-dependent methyltransferase